MYSLEPLKFSSGERYSMLVDDMGRPHFWVTLFITCQVRPLATQSTISSYISDIRHFMLWEEIRGRSIFEEFHNLNFLKDEDVFSLRDHCLLKTKDVRRWCAVENTKKVRRISRGFPSAPRGLDRVCGDHAATRMTRIANYLAFTAKAMLRNRPNIEEINKKVEAMKKVLLAHKPSGRSSHSTINPDDKAPSPEIFDQFMKAVQSNSPDNPYKNETVKARNALMFNLMYQTGARAAEILALKVGDYDYVSQEIIIERRHDDPDDPRKAQPVVKTLARRLKVSRELIEQIDDYVNEERADTKSANKHPYLFVTHQKGPYEGRPLSDNGFSKVVRSAVVKVGRSANHIEQESLFNEIRRHGFRHNFNYRLSLAFDKRNALAKIDKTIKSYSEREQNQIRMELNGWTSEDTANIYNLRHIKEEARRVMTEDMQVQSEWLKKLRK